MSAKDKPISKPMNKQFADNYDRIFGVSVIGKSEYFFLRQAMADMPIGEDVRPKDAIKRGLSSACVEEEWDCIKKHYDDF
tara:strand:+ start:351 stop:590 length:240 start_codon:yes stop_codon:yes gene_type:complete